jgi:hypothetical protein
LQITNSFNFERSRILAFFGKDANFRFRKVGAVNPFGLSSSSDRLNLTNSSDSRRPT